MFRRRTSDALQRAAEATKSITSPLGPAVLPANNWVTEKMGEDGIPTLLPLVGWLVTKEGELRPLPPSLDESWTLRPRAADDERLISAASSRMRPANTR
jgi:hypothetical protein